MGNIIFTFVVSGNIGWDREVLYTPLVSVSFNFEYFL
jgi:hypothetical protein